MKQHLTINNIQYIWQKVNTVFNEYERKNTEIIVVVLTLKVR